MNGEKNKAAKMMQGLSSVEIVKDCSLFFAKILIEIGYWINDRKISPVLVKWVIFQSQNNP